MHKFLLLLHIKNRIQIIFLNIFYISKANLNILQN
jgi:hypothetical protein